MKRSIIIIGNGESLLGKGLGTKIDEFDEVCRVNYWKTLGYEKDAGNKTTLWSLYYNGIQTRKFIDDYLNEGYSYNDMKEIVSNVSDLLYITTTTSKYYNNLPADFIHRRQD